MSVSYSSACANLCANCVSCILGATLKHFYIYFAFCNSTTLVNFCDNITITFISVIFGGPPASYEFLVLQIFSWSIKSDFTCNLQNWNVTTNEANLSHNIFIYLFPWVTIRWETSTRVNSIRCFELKVPSSRDDTISSPLGVSNMTFRRFCKTKIKTSLSF